MNHLPKNINEVLNTLDLIIEETVRENNFLGIFAYVYRRTTAQIKKETENGAFEDNERMQQFDVVFANLYIDAYYNYKAGKPISQSWAIAFDAQKEELASIQHLVMGMNAHIQLDLGVAASRIMKGKNIEALESDYNKVNRILADLTHEMQKRLNRVSFFMFLLDWIGARTDEKIINFSITAARERSWKVAQQLWKLSESEQQIKISEVDFRVMNLSQKIKNPPGMILKFAMKLIKTFEAKNVDTIVAGLSA